MLDVVIVNISLFLFLFLQKGMGCLDDNWGGGMRFCCSEFFLNFFSQGWKTYRDCRSIIELL
jgi:hypothetical protein